ncbi:sigma-70 family RNA polymerase sigma factor [Methylophilus aquaticus]|uniref:Sigma-70 family RNA polymerase sigma factor n=1 Tax=Methylophilus aquaticus TaxID=1971610 RepID=A0ABT9JV59_9PROT|nr:sigma-70 family RNA polymerase sigma factor [Methylophilus aquaticus]MDP8568344.1 sigma-70 family RNA polymerase sigma factor [Methylophilus aquaticus]
MALLNTYWQELHEAYCQHHEWLHGWLRKKTGNSWEAADIAHDTFLRVMHKDKLVQLGAEPRALLVHIAKGLVIDRWRHQQVERAYQETMAQLPADQWPSVEDQLIILETLQQIDCLLRELSAQTRMIFLLAQLDGLTYQHIAEQCAISLITVKRHMRKAYLACLSA